MPRPLFQTIRSVGRLSVIAADNSITPKEVRAFSEETSADLFGFMSYVVEFTVIMGVIGLVASAMSSINSKE